MAEAQLYDVAVVGYGPAGITAALYAARKQLSVLLLGEVPGGEVVTSGEIENWPGSGQTDGIALAEQLVKHLDLHKDVVTVVQTKVIQVTKDARTIFHLTATGDKQYKARTVIYAAGRHPRFLNIPGEAQYKNLGVSYCATCDAPLFPDKAVAVIGGGNSGAEAVIMFQKIARKVYLLHLSDHLKADPILIRNFKDDPKVTVIYNAQTLRIGGEQMVERLVYQDTATKEEHVLDVQGVFVTIGAIPNTEPVKDLVELDQYGAIVADRYGVTRLDGFFAAGDVTTIRDAQIVVAAGHGCSAALSAGDYLSRMSV